MEIDEFNEIAVLVTARNMQPVAFKTMENAKKKNLGTNATGT